MSSSVISAVSPWSGPSGAYDFLSTENATKWSGWLQPGLRKVCSVVLILCRIMGHEV